MLNYTELKTHVATLAQRSGDTSYITDIGVWINLAQDHLFKIYDYWDALKAQIDFTTVDGTALYFFPADFHKPFRMYDITNNRPINIVDELPYFDANIANIADAVEADPNTAYIKEVSGVKVQVSTSGDTVQAKSSSASDTSVDVRVEGYLDSGLTIVGYEDITVTGTTAVAGTTTFYKILHVSKGADSVGFITLEDSSAVDLAILESIQRVSRYKAFRLGKIPDDSTTSIRVLYKKKLRKLVDDDDYPFVDADEYLINQAYAYALNQEKESESREQLVQQRANTALSILLSSEQDSYGPDYQKKWVNSMAQAHRA